MEWIEESQVNPSILMIICSTIAYLHYEREERIVDNVGTTKKEAPYRALEEQNLGILTMNQMNTEDSLLFGCSLQQARIVDEK